MMYFYDLCCGEGGGGVQHTKFSILDSKRSDFISLTSSHTALSIQSVKAIFNKLLKLLNTQ